MIKYFHFIYKGKLDKNQLETILINNYHKKLEVKYFDDNYGLIITSNDFYEVLLNIHPIMVSDLDCNITFLASFENGNLSKKALKIADFKFPNTVNNLSTIYLYSILNPVGENLTFYLDNIFNNIDYELIQTGLTFVQCGMNACLASRQLYIHRNTFNYRLKSFIDITKLDIRDFDNAMVFNLYQKQNMFKK